MEKVVLAGQYPAGTYEKLRAMLPQEQFEIETVENQQDYEALTDVEYIIVRILKTPEAVLANKPHLKAVIRWGAGFPRRKSIWKSGWTISPAGKYRTGKTGYGAGNQLIRTIPASLYE